MEIRARRSAGLVGTVSHRPFLGLPGEVGMARGTRALPGGGSGLGALVEMRARRPAGLVGTVSHRPFSGLPGEVGMARGTRALSEGGRDRSPSGLALPEFCPADEPLLAWARLSRLDCVHDPPVDLVFPSPSGRGVEIPCLLGCYEFWVGIGCCCYVGSPEVSRPTGF